MEKQQKIELQDSVTQASNDKETSVREYVSPKLIDHGTVQELTKTIVTGTVDDGGTGGPVYVSG